MNATLLRQLLAPAQKTAGWHNRKDQPKKIVLDGGCALHVVPAWLWRPRINPRSERFDTMPTPLPRRLAVGVR